MMLSRLVGEEARVLGDVTEALARLDLALACGALSRAWRGCPVEPAGEVDLRAARHPLLDPATAVPIDLPLEGIRALVVSGPNTGGKTVALKTLGLLAMLHQCGLRVPAERARDAGLRPGAGRHRRRPVDRGEPLHLLRPRAPPHRDHGGHRGAVAGAAGRARRRHRPRRGRAPGAGRRRPARRPGRPGRRDHPPPGDEGVGQRGGGRRQRRRRGGHAVAAAALHARLRRAGRVARARHRGAAGPGPRGGGGGARRRPAGAPGPGGAAGRRRRRPRRRGGGARRRGRRAGGRRGGGARRPRPPGGAGPADRPLEGGGRRRSASGRGSGPRPSCGRSAAS